jgi:hypothetical protein
MASPPSVEVALKKAHQRGLEVALNKAGRYSVERGLPAAPIVGDLDPLRNDFLKWIIDAKRSGIY